MFALLFSNLLKDNMHNALSFEIFYSKREKYKIEIYILVRVKVNFG